MQDGEAGHVHDLLTPLSQYRRLVCSSCAHLLHDAHPYLIINRLISSINLHQSPNRWRLQFYVCYVRISSVDYYSISWFIDLFSGKLGFNPQAFIKKKKLTIGSCMLFADQHPTPPTPPPSPPLETSVFMCDFDSIIKLMRRLYIRFSCLLVQLD